MKTLLRSIAVLAVLASLPAAASAQVGIAKRFVTVGVAGGVVVPVNDAKSAFENGYNLQGFARLNIPKLPVMPRFDLNYSRMNLDDVQVGVPGTEQILAGLANIQVPVFPLGPIRPYLLAGLGAYNLKTETEGTTPTSVSKTHFGINGGAGVLLNLGAISGFVEGRIDNVYTENGAIDAKEIQFVPVSFGLAF